MRGIRRGVYSIGIIISAERPCEINVSITNISIITNRGTFSTIAALPNLLNGQKSSSNNMSGNGTVVGFDISARRYMAAQASKSLRLPPWAYRRYIIIHHNAKKDASRVLRSDTQGIGSTVIGCRPNNKPAITAGQILPNNIYKNTIINEVLSTCKVRLVIWNGSKLSGRPPIA